MQTAEAGSPFDFLARFAGPLAWLVAGLLLLFGGVGGPAGPGGPGGAGAIRDISDVLRYFEVERSLGG